MVLGILLRVDLLQGTPPSQEGCKGNSKGPTLGAFHFSLGGPCVAGFACACYPLLALSDKCSVAARLVPLLLLHARALASRPHLPTLHPSHAALRR